MTELSSLKVYKARFRTAELSMDHLSFYLDLDISGGRTCSRQQDQRSSRRSSQQDQRSSQRDPSKISDPPGDPPSEIERSRRDPSRSSDLPSKISDPPGDPLSEIGDPPGVILARSVILPAILPAIFPTRSSDPGVIPAGAAILPARSADPSVHPSEVEQSSRYL